VSSAHFGAQAAGLNQSTLGTHFSCIDLNLYLHLHLALNLNPDLDLNRWQKQHIVEDDLANSQ